MLLTESIKRDFRIFEILFHYRDIQQTQLHQELYVFFQQVKTIYLSIFKKSNSILTDLVTHSVTQKHSLNIQQLSVENYLKQNNNISAVF